MTDSARQCCSEGSTAQSCSRTAAAIRTTCPGGHRVGARVFDLPSASPSLHPTGAATETPHPGERRQARVYGKTAAQLDCTRSSLCARQETAPERGRHTGFAGVVPTRARAWVSRNELGPTLSSWNIVWIDCNPRSWLRLINSWYPSSAGQPVEQPAKMWRGCMNQPAAVYARVSSDRQKENHTIASQTEALKEFAGTHSYMVPPEWVFQDEGYSGAILARPGLESLRDLAAEGQIRAVLVYSPDRLSRKYAYQILLAEEFSRCGVELIFLKSPAGATPEDQLLVQFQGMIAEYERAQIAERSRRGKRHKAQQGVVNVLSGAPYGYRYVRKTETSAAYYEVIEAEARVVRLVFETYTQQGLSINAIARMLNERQIPTRTAKTRWERSTVWAMLRNPAYQGQACYGKTELRPRQRITRPIRQRKAVPSRDSAHHERPRQDWIEVPVTPLVSEDGARTVGKKQTLCANTHRWPNATARNVGVSTMWLRMVSVLHTNLQAPAPLLSLLRFGWVSSAQRAGVHEPSGPTGLSGSMGWERNHRLARRSGAGASGNPQTSRGGPPCRSTAPPRARICIASRPDWKRARNAC